MLHVCMSTGFHHMTALYLMTLHIYCLSHAHIMGAIHSTKILTGLTGKKWSTSKGGPVFSKLFRLDRMVPLSFGPKFP